MLWSLITLTLATCAFAATADEWRNRTIYQLVTDRFALANDSGGPCDTSDRVHCGGSWKGVVKKLDYIQNLGFDAIWISPIVANVPGNTSYGEAFHGYWSQDLTSLNTHFGDKDDLKALSSALHNRSMYLMVDVVVNHMASAEDPPDYSSLSPFSTRSKYHPECFILNYDNQTDVEQCWLGDTDLPLVDIDTEDEDTVKTLYSWVNGLVSDYSVDGIRIDTVRHIRQDFWPDFAKSAGVFTIGEVLDEQTSYVAPYTQLIDSVLDYPTWFSLTAAFQNTTGNLSALASTVWSSQAAYKSGEMMTGSFLENHDQPRFQSLTQDQSLVKNAMTWPFVQDGIPIMYYGQEQGYAGGKDPANREALWLSGYDEDKPLVTFVKVLNSARRAAIAANKNYLTTPATLYAVTQSTLAVSKPPMLALLTNVGHGADVTWSVPDAGYKGKEKLIDILTCTSVTADKHGGVIVHGTSGNPQILMPASALSPTGSLCSNMATGEKHWTSAASRTLTGEHLIDWLMVTVTLALAVVVSHPSLLMG